MDLKEQEYVVALAEYGSITRAAEALFISQPTLSIFLSRLENRLGTPLFDKIGRKLVPTVAGELYVRRAKELLMIQSQFQGELSDLISGSYGRLRLGIHSRRSSYLLPKVMAQFRIQYPNVDLSLCETGSADMEQKLMEGSLDLILSNRFLQPEKLAFFPIYQDTLVAALPFGHPACEKTVMLPCWSGATWPGTSRDSPPRPWTACSAGWPTLWPRVTAALIPRRTWWPRPRSFMS